MMNILALDTSQMTYSMFCSQKRRLIKWESNQVSITKAFNMACDQQPDAIVLCNGPGRYSGIRAGMAFAQGISAGLNTPIYTLTGFEIIASKVEKSDFTVVLDARKQQVYSQIFSNENPNSDQSITNIEDLKDVELYGNLPHPLVTQVSYNAEDILNLYLKSPTLRSTQNPQAIYIRSATD
jgi:tRNA threonylcarbamoyl adenosine modification protein YeaZ